MKTLAVRTQTYSSRRIEALTDGVFAIAMTLLVLDLHVGDLGNITSSAELWQHIYNTRIAILSFVISFLLLGSMWAVHTRQFEYLKATDRHATALNTFRLLVVVFMPLTTSIAANYPTLVLGRVLLPLNFLILSLVSVWQWQYSSNPSRKLAEKMSGEDRTYFSFRNRAIVVLALMVVIASVPFGQAAFAILALAPLLNRSMSKKFHLG